MRDVLAEALDTTVATKADVRDRKTDIARLEVTTKADMQAMEMRLSMRLGAMMVAIVSVAVAFLRMHP